MPEGRWLVLQSRLDPPEVMRRLQGSVVNKRRVRPRLAGAPIVLSTSESSFVVRAHGYWHRYLVEGSLEPADGGCRILLHVERAGRFAHLQTIGGIAVALAAVPLVGLGLPMWALFRVVHPAMVWCGAVLAVALVVAGGLAATSSSAIRESDVRRLTRNLCAILDAQVRE